MIRKGLVLFATLFFSTVISGARSRVHAAADEKISPELQKVIDGANEEGVLRIQWTAGRLGGDAGVRKMVDAMNKRYGTHVELQFTPGPNFPKMLTKLVQEYAAGQKASSDIQLGSANHIALGRDKGMLRKLDWETILERPLPKDANIKRSAGGGFGVAIASRVVGITYNTKLVKEADVPHSMEDVFKPQFKGKIASTPYASGLYQFGASDMLGYEYMKNYTQRLAKQIGGLMSCNAMERVASGEFMMLVFDCGQDDAIRMARRGAPVAQTTVDEIARVNIIYFGIPKNAEHPNAGILFANFLNTEEGQKLQWELAGHDLHIYPEAHTRKPVQRILAKGGKLFIDTVERSDTIGPEEIRKMQREFAAILKNGGK
jgi:ABC-type Fe3+ transport system substrate-binding protein